jgi:hypothetical protein
MPAPHRWAGWQAPPGAGRRCSAEASRSGAPAAAWLRPTRRTRPRAERVERHRRREGTIGLIFGLLLVLLGIWFLFREYVPEVDLEAFWPIAIIALGVMLLVRAFRLDRGADKT